jgi:dihydroxyacid dehydratase/phosphogluconate dehydratase
MLNHAMAESRSSGSVLIGVIRDGQRIQLVVPEGPLGVQVEDQVLIAIRNRVSSLSAAQ